MAGREQGIHELCVGYDDTAFEGGGYVSCHAVAACGENELIYKKIFVLLLLLTVSLLIISKLNVWIYRQNYFGVKGKGPEGSVNVSTTEEINGEDVSIKDDFRAYDSMEESIEDHANLLLNVYKRYVTTGTVEDWIDALIEGGYAKENASSFFDRNDFISFSYTIYSSLCRADRTENFSDTKCLCYGRYKASGGVCGRNGSGNT